MKSGDPLVAMMMGIMWKMTAMMSKKSNMGSRGDDRLASAFLATAPKVANEACWGNLSCHVLCDPATQRRLRAEVEECVAALRFGTVGVNAPAQARTRLQS